MQTVDLAGTGRSTTRLGYGCSSVMGGMNRSESLRALEWAYDAGVRHFDVAPMYGYGAAEGCLGEFLARHPGECTVTTKFGIPPASNPGMMQLARKLAKPLINAVPGLKQRAQRAATAMAAAPEARDLSPVRAQESLDKSLQELRVERIDVFLLHDATAAEVRGNEPLLEMLQRAQQQGKVGVFGVGSEREDVALIQSESPAFARVTQCEWSVFHPITQDGSFHIHHRSLAQYRRRLLQYLDGSPDVRQRWTLEMNTDLRAPGILSALMMRAALRAYPRGIVLFSSKDKTHIEHNAALAEPSPLDASADALYAIVQREAAQIPAERAG
jgi:D-threo-aldose 1-dehydrogenase